MSWIEHELRMTLWYNQRIFGRSGTADVWTSDRARVYQGLPTFPGGIPSGDRYLDVTGAVAACTADPQGVCSWTRLPSGIITVAVNTRGGSNWTYHPLWKQKRIGLPEKGYRVIPGDGTRGPWTLTHAGGTRKAWGDSVRVYYMGTTWLEPGNEFTTTGTTVSLVSGKIPHDSIYGDVLTVDEYIVAEWDYLPGGGY